MTGKRPLPLYLPHLSCIVIDSILIVLPEIAVTHLHILPQPHILGLLLPEIRIIVDRLDRLNLGQVPHVLLDHVSVRFLLEAQCLLLDLVFVVDDVVGAELSPFVGDVVKSVDDFPVAIVDILGPVHLDFGVLLGFLLQLDEPLVAELSGFLLLLYLSQLLVVFGHRLSLVDEAGVVVSGVEVPHLILVITY